MNTSADRTGTTLGEYQLDRLIGRGGMGEVYEATDNRLGRTVALKILRPEFAENKERRARFDREAKALATLNHPGIVTIYALETVDDTTFFTMELIDGKTLAEMIRDEGIMDTDRILQLAIPISDALAAAHKRGIAHRDMKPENIIVKPSGEITVLDFGLAKTAIQPIEQVGVMATEDVGVSIEGQILGTVNYIAPEQAQGGETNPTSDVFSMGVILYEMATGTSPFTGDTTMSFISSVLKDDPPPIKEFNGTVPEELERIIHRCLVKDPDRRWQTAIEIRNELEILKEEQANPQKQEEVAAVPVVKSSRMSLMALAAALMVMMGVTFWFWNRAEQTEKQRQLAVTAKQEADQQKDQAIEQLNVAEKLIATENQSLQIEKHKRLLAERNWIFSCLTFNSGVEDQPSLAPDNESLVYSCLLYTSPSPRDRG